MPGLPSRRWQAAQRKKTLRKVGYVLECYNHAARRAIIAIITRQISPRRFLLPPQPRRLLLILAAAKNSNYGQEGERGKGVFPRWVGSQGLSKHREKGGTIQISRGVGKRGISSFSFTPLFPRGQRREREKIIAPFPPPLFQFSD